MLKKPRNPSGLEAEGGGVGGKSSSALPAPLLVFYTSLHRSSKLLCMCAGMNAVVTPNNLMCSNQMTRRTETCMPGSPQ